MSTHFKTGINSHEIDAEEKDLEIQSRPRKGCIVHSRPDEEGGYQERHTENLQDDKYFSAFLIVEIAQPDWSECAQHCSYEGRAVRSYVKCKPCLQFCILP